MNRHQTIIVLIIAITTMACGISRKKAITESAPSSNPGPPLVFMPPPGISFPGEEELTAIRLQFSDATMSQLKEGFSIYTEGACIKCHHANNIYFYSEVKWKTIIEEMAPMAQISNAEKDAVYRYVLSIKATQPK